MTTPEIYALGTVTTGVSFLVIGVALAPSWCCAPARPATAPTPARAWPDMAAPVITTADAAGVALLVDWAAAEGWNPGLDDAAAFRSADPDGFLIATVDGEAVGGVRSSPTTPATGSSACS